jgi:hypothetical protein
MLYIKTIIHFIRRNYTEIIKITRQQFVYCYHNFACKLNAAIHLVCPIKITSHE